MLEHTVFNAISDFVVLLDKEGNRIWEAARSIPDASLVKMPSNGMSVIFFSKPLHLIVLATGMCRPATALRGQENYRARHVQSSKGWIRESR